MVIHWYYQPLFQIGKILIFNDCWLCIGSWLYLRTLVVFTWQHKRRMCFWFLHPSFKVSFMFQNYKNTNVINVNLCLFSHSCRLIARTLLWTRVLVLLQVSRQGQRPVWRFVSNLISWGKWEASSDCPQESVATTSFPYMGSASPPKPRARLASGLVATSLYPSRMYSCRPQLSLFR